MLKTFKREYLPLNVYFGDGEDIDEESLDIIRTAYAKHHIIFDWQDSDLLPTDNMLYAHVGQPYQGSRRVLVGIAIDECQ